MAAAILAWVLVQAKQGLAEYFSTDDIMNMYWAWTEPLGKLIRANVMPFTSDSYRPLGAAVYRLGFSLFGLSAVPFRVFVFTLLLLNAWLVFRLAKHLTGCVEISVLAAFLISFHHRLDDIYLNNGTIYDVLCCTFYLLSLLYYIHVRKQGTFHVKQYLMLYILTVAAINSKEIGVTLPLMLLAYEFLFLRGDFRTAGAAWMTVLVVALSIRRKLDGGSHFANNPEYTLHLSLHQYLYTTRKYFDNLFLRPDDTFTTAGVITVLFLLVLIAIIARRRYLWFCALLIIMGALPVNFITPRSLFAFCVPMIGWAIYTASVLVVGRDWLHTHLWHRPPLSASTWEPERVYLFVAVAAVLWNVNVHDRPIDWMSNSRERSPLFHFKTDLERLHLKPSSGSRVLLLDDRFDTGEWIPMLLFRMSYHSPDLTLDRAKSMDHTPQGAELNQYTYVLNYQNDHLVQVKGVR